MHTSAYSRYDRDAAGTILIDVAADNAEDLYEVFDRSAPYSRRDLNQNLVSYLIDCAEELEREPFGIRFSLDSPLDADQLRRVERSVSSYFLYLVEAEHRKLQQMIRRSMLFFGLGIAIMYMSVWVNSWLGVERSAVANVFAEGLTVAAWVSLWEALATLLVKWLPRRRSSKRYQRLASAELTFRSSIDTPAAGPDVPVHTDGSNRSAV